MLTSGWVEFAGFIVPALFIICVALLFWMRDPLPGTARRVSHVVWCPHHHRIAEVVFREGSGRSGLVRMVEACPLRRRGERCGEACELPPPRAAWIRRIESRRHPRPSHWN
jgi:hypothetical protein